MLHSRNPLQRQSLLMNSSEFLTDLQLAERWQLHRQTLIRWRRAGCGPDFMRVEGRVLYPLAAVEQYEKANTITLGGK
jgi:predicted site-specific integrase-resolvase